jgi:hypothetical protein
VVVSNHKFFDHFTTWKESCSLSHPVVVLDDGSTDNSNRLGAVRDILFAIEEQEIDEDLLVLAGDNLLDFLPWWFCLLLYREAVHLHHAPL